MIRNVRLSDLPRLVELYRVCFREPPWFEEFTVDEVMADFQKMLELPEIIFLVAEKDDYITGGFIAYDFARREDIGALLKEHPLFGQTIYSAEIFIDPRTRQRGLARSLIADHLAIAKRNGYTHMAARTSIDQQIIQHLYLDWLEAGVVARQTVVSTKIIDGIKTESPDERVIMYGKIPSL
ncbi:MAG: GNAT family N-acetyltransferase [Patescibacteria group bacterium]|jgi:ribosomal protein S18 acetylase RimI-like enzyme